MDYVPTSDQIQEHFNQFLVEPIKIEGVYGNYDVDSVFFSYTSKTKQPIKEYQNHLFQNDGLYTNQHIQRPSFSKPRKV